MGSWIRGSKIGRVQRYFRHIIKRHILSLWFMVDMMLTLLSWFFFFFFLAGLNSVCQCHHCRVTSLPFLWKEVTMYGPHLRSGELCFPLLLFFFFLTVICNQRVLCWLCLSKCYLQKLSPFSGFSVLLNTADSGCYLTLFLQHLIWTVTTVFFDFSLPLLETAHSPSCLL